MEKLNLLKFGEKTYVEKRVTKNGQKNVGWIVKNLTFPLSFELPDSFDPDSQRISGLVTKLVYDESLEEVALPKKGEAFSCRVNVIGKTVNLSVVVSALSSQHQGSLFRMQVVYQDEEPRYSAALKVVSKQRQIKAKREKDSSRGRSKKTSATKKRRRKSPRKHKTPPKRPASPKKIKYDTEDEDYEEFLDVPADKSYLEHISAGINSNKKKLEQLMHLMQQPRQLSVPQLDLCSGKEKGMVATFIDFVSMYHDADQQERIKAITKIKRAVHASRLSTIVEVLESVDDPVDQYATRFSYEEDGEYASKYEGLEIVPVEEKAGLFDSQETFTGYNFGPLDY